jgi:hypothetical protein
MHHPVFIVLLALSIPFMIQAQQGDDFTIKKISTAIKVDGSPDDEAWKNIEEINRFWQYFPTDTVPAQQGISVKICYDHQHLYFLAVMKNRKKDRTYITPSLRRDFRGEANDGFSLIIDPFQDQTNGFQFGVNPFGVQREGLVSNGGSEGTDLSLSWDNKWYADAKQFEGYWVAEGAIPFSTLRFKPGSRYWNFKFYRIDSESAERVVYPRLPRQFQILNLVSVCKGVWEEPITKKSTNISLIPYTLANSQVNNLKNEPVSNMANFGGDAKISLGPALNLDLTVNPDFSQVEVDEQITNLDRFEIFFPERRQFFLENADLFASFGQERLRPFFSRRIGIARDKETGQNIQNPIYFGARLSGKLDNNWRIGLLSMQTARDISINQPSINYSVAAVQRKIFSRSNVGVIFVQKEPFNDEKIIGGNSGYNRVIGFDYNLATVDNKWSGKAFYHQSFDEEKKGNSGVFGGDINYNTYRWDFSFTGQYVGENYHPEVGFARRTDYRRTASALWYNFYPKAGIFNRHGPGIDFDYLGNEKYGLTDFDVNLMYRIIFRNTANLEFRLRREFVYLFSPFNPSGGDGPSLEEGRGYAYNLFILRYISNTRKKVNYFISSRSGQYFNGNRWNLDGSVNIRLQPYALISMVASINILRFPKPYRNANLFLIGPRIDITFSKNLFWTTFFQYNAQIDNLNINSRLQWRFQPVSDVFLVYTDNYYPESFINKNRAVVLKINYWLN